MNGELRVLVVDDHPVVRRGLRAMLSGEHWVGEVLEADTVAAAVRAAVTEAVDLVAMDVALPDGDGIDATARILRARPDTKVLILTMADDEDVATRALRAGARGYVLKLTDPETVVDALRAVAAGSIVLGPSIGSALLTAASREPAALPAPFDQLTERERQIVTLLAKGDSNARIARQLGVSEKTIRNQLTPLFTKLGVTDRVQAALRARDAGFGA
ncbi:response regulator transcription factor [Nonomuraea sp. NPDC048892]|uniref:response regulator transcription factor n=1 Tax=Nonomuraea sp. NPDC048892 TaxID=3154624 RepID=UPI0033E4D6FB